MAYPQWQKRLVRNLKDLLGLTPDRPSLLDEIDGVIERFLATGRNVTFGFTGGEPLHYPGFTEICRRIASHESFSIALDSNLSSDSIFRITEAVPPEKFEYIFSALHVLERERIFGETGSFVDRILRLKDGGYPVDVNYVLHPLLFDRARDDYQRCLDRGLRLSIKTFKGVWQGRRYPGAYTDEETAFMRENFPSDFKRDRFVSRRFLGRSCNAGMSLVQVWENGDMTRCLADTTLLGNIYTGFELNETAMPCILAGCPCFDPSRLFDDPREKPVTGKLDLKLARARQILHTVRRIWVHPQT